MKYKVGDRVEIISHGHAIMRIVNRKSEWIDLHPEYVGKEAIIMEYTEPQPGFERYSLDIDGIGKVSWFGLKQLKKIE